MNNDYTTVGRFNRECLWLDDEGGAHICCAKCRERLARGTAIIAIEQTYFAIYCVGCAATLCENQNNTLKRRNGR